MPDLWSSTGAFVFGPPANRKLPTRIQESIRRQQVQAEILIGWTQLVLVLFFFALYSVAPRPGAATPFQPVPWVLGAFFVFTLIRLLLAYRRVIAVWFLAGSVLLDVGLLMLLIWSFHIQYAQPAAFYLKAPTLLYAFLFIALRTLRFDPTYVVVAGVGAALGWVALLLYALSEPSLTSLVTHDYILYITSSRILVGAEVDKILCIVLVTAVLATAIIRARRLLTHSVTEADVARELTRFVAPELASHIAGAEHTVEPGDGRVLEATILFCDIEGFSTISERMAPERLIQTLNEYFNAISEIVERNGGVVTAFQGDAVLIAFNTARPRPRHAEAALRTALDIQSLVSARRFGDGLLLKTRCGINTGPVLAGAVGTRDRLLFTVYGDEVNIAARLEQLNKSFGTYVLASERTLVAAGSGFRARPMGEMKVRGRSRTVSVHAVLAVDEEATADVLSEGDPGRRRPAPEV